MGQQAKYKQASIKQLQDIVNESNSYIDVLRKLGYSGTGSQTSLIKYLKENNIDTSHFTGQGWNKNNFNYEKFQYGKAIRSSHMKDALVYLRGNKCECCGLEKWKNEDIPLEVHHIDGDHLNNVLENLQLLCPNCHALTDNWRGKNIKKSERKIISEEDFVKALKENTSIRQALISLGLTGAGANYERANQLIAKYDIKM